MIKQLNIFLACIVAFASCATKTQEASKEEAVKYNNKVTTIWNKLVALDNEIEQDFQNNYYSFFSPRDSLYLGFIQKKMNEVETLLEKAKEIDDLNDNNEMKMLLLQTLFYIRNNTLAYYTTLLQYGEKHNKKYLQLVDERNKRLQEFELSFREAQNELATQFQFEIAE